MVKEPICSEKNLNIAKQNMRHVELSRSYRRLPQMSKVVPLH